MSGSKPRAENAEASVRGALLGFETFFGAGLDTGASIFGLYVNKEEIIWAGGGREL